MLCSTRITIRRFLLYVIVSAVLLLQVSKRAFQSLATPQVGTQALQDPEDVHFSVAPLTLAQQVRLSRNKLDIYKVAVAIEMHDQPHAVALLLHYIAVLDPEWIIRIYHGKALERRLQSWRLQKHIRSGKLMIIPLNLNITSSLSMSTFFGTRNLWDHLAPADNIFLFTFDSIMCSQASLKPEIFFHYDFIGPPVVEDIRENALMTGRLSLRLREGMLRTIDEFGPITHPKNANWTHEEQFFVKKLQDNYGNVPSVEAAAVFAVQTLYAHAPIAVHQAAKMLGPRGYWRTSAANYTHLSEQYCPELKMLPYSGDSSVLDWEILSPSGLSGASAGVSGAFNSSGLTNDSHAARKAENNVVIGAEDTGDHSTAEATETSVLSSEPFDVLKHSEHSHKSHQEKTQSRT